MPSPDCIDGLWPVVPDGIDIAVVESIFTICETGGDKIKSFPEVDEIVLSITITSLTFKEFVVFKIPVEVILPEDEIIWIEFPILTFPPKFTGEDIDNVESDDRESVVIDVADKVPVLKLLLIVASSTAMDPPEKSIAVRSPVEILLDITSVEFKLSTSRMNPEPNTFGLFKSIVNKDSWLSSPPSSSCPSVDKEQ